MIEYFPVLFVGDGVKSRPRRIIRQHAGLERNTGEVRGKLMKQMMRLPTGFSGDVIKSL
jgi:hypothetical protein